MAASDIDSDLWHAIVGSPTRIPTVNTDVYYFPQGYIENSFKNREINDRFPPPILCKVLNVRYLCTHSSDQAFVKFLLLPIHQSMRKNNNNNNNKNCDVNEKADQSDIIYFSKILTASDANNGGGFSVPRFGADSIFPRLNFSDDPPVQTLKMFDAHQKAYEFRHIYRGTPRRHLLTTGWSKFVNGKRLVAGDSVVFMQKKSTGRLFISARRLRYACGEGFLEDWFREGIENARTGKTFEVVYYPRMGMPNFVVSADKVEESMGREWRVGMRVKMVTETEDSSRVSWFQGTIERVDGMDNNGSPWGMIQVNWDEPEILQITRRVSPWQVECAIPLEEEHHSPFPPPYKKLKAPIMLPNEEADFSFPELTQSTSTHNSGMFHYSSFSNMQGVCVDPIPDVPNSTNRNPFGSFTQLLKNGLENEPRPVSKVLNLRSTSCYENAPPTRSLRLFGQTIHVPGGTENYNKHSCGERSGVHQEISGVDSQANNNIPISRKQNAL